LVSAIFVLRSTQITLNQKFPYSKVSFIAKKEKWLKHLGRSDFNALPNIVCYATKVRQDVDYRPQIEKILAKSLVGRESKILDVWMKDVPGDI